MFGLSKKLGVHISLDTICIPSDALDCNPRVA